MYFKSKIYSFNVFQFHWKFFSLILRFESLTYTESLEDYLSVSEASSAKQFAEQETLLGSCPKTDWILKEAYIKEKKALA